MKKRGFTLGAMAGLAMIAAPWAMRLRGTSPPRGGLLSAYIAAQAPSFS